MKVSYTRVQALRISRENLSAGPLLCMGDFPEWTLLDHLSLCYLVNKQNQIDL